MIKIIQLVTAQEIIGDIENDPVNSDTYLVKDPANIHMVPQGNGGSFGIGLIPFMPYVDGRLAVKKDKVIITAEPSVEMRNNYSKMFGSGIEIANVMPK